MLVAVEGVEGAEGAEGVEGVEVRGAGAVAHKQANKREGPLERGGGTRAARRGPHTFSPSLWAPISVQKPISSYVTYTHNVMRDAYIHTHPDS
ncbi:hypothetical protein AB1N83_012467 [Pleurotus pulmonarius]